MKLKLVVPLFALCLPATGRGADFAAWTHRQTVTVNRPGLTRLELEPDLLDRSRAAGGAPFHDLRLVNPSGIETPWIVAMPRLEPLAPADAVAFKASLATGSTVLEFQAPRAATMSEVLLQTNAADFIKAATLEGSLDGATWNTLAAGEVICRKQGTVRLRIGFEPAVWRHFRITLDDRRTLPVVFTGAQIRYESPELRTVPHAVSIRSRTEEGGNTRLIVDLGTANVLLARLRVRTPEAVFRRQATLFGTKATLFRLQHEGRTAENLDVPAHQLAAEREIQLLIDNGDSPPLRIDGIDGTRHPVPLLFQADTAGEWQLFIGNAQAAEPRYDLAFLRERLRNAPAESAVASAAAANTGYRKAANAPEVGADGMALDVSAWVFRRGVECREAGVVEVELTPEVVARAASDLHDLRVIRDGRQVPFLMVHSDTPREVDAPFAAVSDPKNPSWSKWAITLPFERFPATGLVLDSPTPLFSRQLSAVEHQVTGQGRAAPSIGSAHWQRTPSVPPRPLHLPLHTPPKTGQIELATDNGDNPPLQLGSVRLRYPDVRIWFRVVDAAPVHLYYGNDRAAHPHYDLNMVRQEFATAAKVTGVLGAEEQLAAFKPQRPGISGKGSPWLWATLVLVVAGLLGVVAKMLPPMPSS